MSLLLFVSLNNQLICSFNQFMSVVQIYILVMQQFSPQQRSSYYSVPTAGVRAQQDPDQTGHGCQTCICISRVQKDGPPNHWQEMLWVLCKMWLITSPVCSSELCAFFFFFFNNMILWNLTASGSLITCSITLIIYQNVR